MATSYSTSEKENYGHRPGEMVVGDVQSQISGIPTGKANIGRDVEHLHSLLHDASSL
jgi:hypothetical protein